MGARTTDSSTGKTLLPHEAAGWPETPANKSSVATLVMAFSEPSRPLEPGAHAEHEPYVVRGFMLAAGEV